MARGVANVGIQREVKTGCLRHSEDAWGLGFCAQDPDGGRMCTDVLQDLWWPTGLVP